MSKQKSNQGITIGKSEDFSEWFTQAIEKAEIVDIRNNVKGFVVMRPLGAQLIENMIALYTEKLHATNHKPTFMPTVIPATNLKKESSHVEGFTPEVFWLKDVGGEKLALRPTSETLYTPMFKFWIRSHRDLPMKLYQRGHVFRLDTKATRPLIRGREFIWIEAHNAFATREDAVKQTQEDIQITEEIMHQKFGIPFLPMKRPNWDRFAGAEFTIGSDCLLPDGKLIQQPSTHMMGQKFSRAFDARFKKDDGTEDYLYTTAYGPAFSRILVSVIATHGDDKGLVLPFVLAPTQVMIVPIVSKTNKDKVQKECEKIQKSLINLNIRTEIDNSDKSPGEKFNIAELKGVPFRIDIGERDLKKKEVTFYTRDTHEKKQLKLSLLKTLPKLGKDYDERLLKKADSFMHGKIKDTKTIADIKTIVEGGKIARMNFCSVEEDGAKCAEYIEKKISAEVRGTRADKNEKAKGSCLICDKPATAVVYVGKSY